jgi:hypothetical protein
MSVEDYAAILASQRHRSRGFLYDPIAAPFPRIFLGAGHQLSPRVARSLQVTHVLNCADDTAAPPWVRNALKYKALNAIDSPEVRLFDTWYPDFKRTMDAYLRDPTCQSVYVHCHAGINRSAFLLAAYLVHTFGVPPLRCVRAMVLQRPCIMQNESFLKQFVDFVKKTP